MIVNGFKIEPRPSGGYAIIRPSGRMAASAATRQSAIDLANKFVPEDADGRPLERYVAAPLWRRLQNPGAVGHWERTS